MEELEMLTVKEVAKLWKKDEQTIRKYVADGVLTPSKVPGIMFNKKYIAEFEGVELERFSPLEKKRLERELEEYKSKYESVKSVLATILSESSKVINL